MDSTLKNMLDAGKLLVRDTKIPGQKKQETKKVKAPNNLDAPVEKDPHKKFVKSVIKDNLGKKEIVEFLQDFIKQAEAEL